MWGRGRAALFGISLGIALAAPGTLAQAKTGAAAREVFGQVKSVNTLTDTVVISHIETARAVASSTLSFSVLHATLKNALGSSSGFHLSDIKAGDVVDGYSAVSAAVTAADELHGIPVPLGTLQDLTQHLTTATLNVVDLAANCVNTSLTVENVCGHFIWGGLTRISAGQLTILAEGHKAKLNITSALLFGGWPVPTPVTTAALRVGETIIAATPPLTSFTTTLHDVNSGTPVPIISLYEAG